jgi:hypothetical protein
VKGECPRPLDDGDAYEFLEELRGLLAIRDLFNQERRTEKVFSPTPRSLARSLRSQQNLSCSLEFFTLTLSTYLSEQLNYFA